MFTCSFIVFFFQDETMCESSKEGREGQSAKMTIGLSDTYDYKIFVEKS